MFRHAVVAVGLASALLGGWAFAWEPAALRVVEHEVEVDDWPHACDGLRVATLSDLHVGSPFNGLGKLERIVSDTLAAEPDMVLLLGDYVIRGVLGGSYVTPEAIADELDRLVAPMGVYAVLGNHDWWDDPERISRALEASGISTLEDVAVPRSRGDCKFWLAGVSDLWEAPHDVERALSRVPEGATILAFTHNPDIFPEIPERVALTLAGHTHSGQVALPWLGRPIVPSAHGERFAIGHVREGGRDLFVTSGLGTNILPVRFRVPPEISLVTIRSQP
ncbi:MAG: metallophosphoesterase [Deltaproteobacteria bacterium]|nr:metallophosphoesterase [Deltaproteobacteria bacterium]MBW2444288.1 metallophosphoesterase [Deltaproteobacteria bacterium]